MEGRIRALRVDPGKKPERVKIDNTLEALQVEVDGYIETITLASEVCCVICNEEGKLRGLPPNRPIYNIGGKIRDIIYGTFLIVGVDGDEFCSMSPSTMELICEVMR